MQEVLREVSVTNQWKCIRTIQQHPEAALDGPDCAFVVHLNGGCLYVLTYSPHL
jgi:hypothetical protein